MSVDRRIVDFEMHQGKDKVLRVTVRDRAGAIVPSAGVGPIKWVMAASVDAETNFIEKQTGAGIELVGGAHLIFEVAITPSDNADIPPGTHYHEAELTDAASRKGTPVQGDAVVIDTRIT